MATGYIWVEKHSPLWTDVIHVFVAVLEWAVPGDCVHLQVGQKLVTLTLLRAHGFKKVLKSSRL